MRLRNNPKASIICNQSIYFKPSEVIQKTDIKNLFNNQNDLFYLEIGSGKGSFLFESSLKYPNVNFLGIEKSLTIIAKAINKYNSAEPTLNNLLLTCADAKTIETFVKPQSVDKIFLNFSDPWPKKAHQKRRLIDLYFINKYQLILKPNGLIEFKTDNEQLFDYCLSQLKIIQSVVKIIDFTTDLYSLSETHFLKLNNIKTEYEKKFINQNIKIKKIVFQFV